MSPRSRRAPRSLVAALALVIAALLLAAGNRSGAGAGREPSPVAGDAAAAFLAARNAEIALYEGRVERDPGGALDRAQLAGLYLQRSRETGNHADLHKAEDSARRSIERLPGARNGKAYHALASCLLAQHRFAEAAGVVETLLVLAPDQTSYRALLGEIRLELGAYAATEAIFQGIEGETARAPEGGEPDLSTLARIARWREVTGRTEDALRLLETVRTETLARAGVPAEQAAWSCLRVGDLLFRSGRLDDAEAAFREGLARNPADYKILAALARCAAVRGRWRETIVLAESSLAVVERRAFCAPVAGSDSAVAAVIAAVAPPDAALLGLAGDAYLALGDSSEALERWDLAEAAGAAHAEAFPRAWYTFLLDHDRRVGEIAVRLRAEILERPDVAGFDLLAWALYKNGEIEAAREASGRALGLGTRDALFEYHAGLIAAAAGDPAGAREHLTRALAICPDFHHRGAPRARAVLDSVGVAG